MSDGTVRGDETPEHAEASEAAANTGDTQPDSESVRISLYEAVGGAAFFEAAVDHFYDAVLDDPVLRPLYPEDLTEARRHTALFLIQYWGGPGTYSEERGHPRLRMRHLPFSIGQAERDAWLRRMMAGIDAALAAPPDGSLLTHPTEGSAIAGSVRSAFADYFDQASTAMINQP